MKSNLVTPNCQQKIIIILSFQFSQKEKQKNSQVNTYIDHKFTIRYN